MIVFSLFTGAKDKSMIEITNKTGKPADPFMFLQAVSSDPNLSDWLINRTKDKSVIIKGITNLKVSPPKINALNQTYCDAKKDAMGLGFSNLNQATRCIQGLADSKVAPDGHQFCFICCNDYYNNRTQCPIDCEPISFSCVRCCYNHNW